MIRTVLSASVAACALTSSASAILNSFTPNDGYQIVQPWVDVTYFNAGGYGANAGGGSYTHIAPDSGKWKVVGQVGGFFTSSAARAAATSGAPPYGVVPSNALPIYIVGDHGPGRTDNSSLAFRNDSPAGTGAAKYEYSIDTYDTGGVAPSTVTSGTVSTQFYFNPNPADPPNPGALPRDRFTMSFKDSAGNVGLQWGYRADNEIVWRASASGAWTNTGVYGTSGAWDGVRVSLDLTADTFKIDYYVASSNMWQQLVAGATPMGMAMNNFTTLGWQLEDNIFTGTGGKNFFDDFSFNIPAPGTALFGLASLTLLRRRRP
ncbi:MAG: hypothetical protein JSR77_06660 [Planctomycetes bacterium]|nr:hypothetical protein [Planctomycetota bacterium]